MYQPQRRDSEVGFSNVDSLSLHTDTDGERDIYDELQELKRVFAAEAKAFSLDLLEEFPELPEDLPSDIVEQAYKKWAPVCTRFAGINTVADAIPLRGNSKLWKKGKD